MKKSSSQFEIGAQIFFSLIFLVIVTNVSAQTNNPEDVAGVLGEQFNISPDKIPLTPEQINQQLKQEWAEVISNNSVFGPINSALTKSSWLFVVLTNHRYELSVEFFVVITLWIFFFKGILILIRSFYKEEKIVWLYALGGVVIVSHLKLINLTTGAILGLTFGQESWWARLIIGIITFGIVESAYIFVKLIAKKAKQQKNKEKEKTSTKKIKEIAEFTKGLDEGKKIAEK